MRTISRNTQKSNFNKDKYVKNMCELMMDSYGISKSTAMFAINNSRLLDSLKINPELTSHIPEESWCLFAIIIRSVSSQLHSPYVFRCFFLVFSCILRLYKWRTRRKERRNEKP